MEKGNRDLKEQRERKSLTVVVQKKQKVYQLKILHVCKGRKGPDRSYFRKGEKEEILTSPCPEGTVSDKEKRANSREGRPTQGGSKRRSKTKIRG